VPPAGGGALRLATSTPAKRVGEQPAAARCVTSASPQAAGGQARAAGPGYVPASVGSMQRVRVLVAPGPHGGAAAMPSFPRLAGSDWPGLPVGRDGSLR
jgi:hypothetical protein